jgi:DNA-binding NtrC family response regulator
MNKIKDKKIFIVDDNQYWSEVLCQMLKEIGFTDIHLFSNGIDCIMNIHLNPVIIFLDYQMDDIDGLEVLKQIKSYYPGVGVVFCTGNEDLGVALNAIQEGSEEYLLKSNATKKELEEMITRIVHSRKFIFKEN